FRQRARVLQGRGVPQARQRLELLQQARAAVGQAESAAATGLADQALSRELVEARRTVNQEFSEAEHSLEGEQKRAEFFSDLMKAGERWVIQVNGEPDKRGALEGYRRAFEEYGCDVTQGPVGAVAEWLRGLPAEDREAALVALYDWCSRASPREL